jgi:hypothetical protein
MKSKEASWKERFAADLLAIRRRVIAEKRLGIQEAPRSRRKTVERVCASTKAARSRHFTDASFAKDLRNWWISQKRFRLQLELAIILKTDPKTVSSWFASKKFPRGRFCDRLFELSGLNCFSASGRKAARREHRAKKLKR